MSRPRRSVVQNNSVVFLGDLGVPLGVLGGKNVVPFLLTAGKAEMTGEAGIITRGYTVGRRNTVGLRRIGI